MIFFLTSKILKNVDIYIGNQNEILNITKQKNVQLAAKVISKVGPKIIIITFGKKGALIYNKQKFIKIPAFKQKNIIDCVGAGDAFASAFLTNYLEGKTLYKSGIWGAATSFFIIQGFGLSNLPSRYNIEELITLRHSKFEK